MSVKIVEKRSPKILFCIKATRTLAKIVQITFLRTLSINQKLQQYGKHLFKKSRWISEQKYLLHFNLSYVHVHNTSSIMSLKEAAHNRGVIIIIISLVSTERAEQGCSSFRVLFFKELPLFNCLVAPWKYPLIRLFFISPDSTDPVWRSLGKLLQNNQK